MIQTVWNLPGTTQFKNLWFFAYIVQVSKNTLWGEGEGGSRISSEVLCNLIWHFRTCAFATCAITAINVFTRSTSISCNTNEHWLLWQVHNIHDISSKIQSSPKELLRTQSSTIYTWVQVRKFSLLITSDNNITVQIIFWGCFLK